MASPADRFNAHTAKRAVGKLPHHRVARALATSVLGFIGVLVRLLSRILDKDLRVTDDHVLKELPKLDCIGSLPARALAEEELGAVLMGDLNHVTYREGGCAILVVYFRQRFLIFAQQLLRSVGDMEDFFSYVCPRFIVPPVTECLGWSGIQLECAGDAALDGPRVFLRGKTAPIGALE